MKDIYTLIQNGKKRVYRYFGAMTNAIDFTSDYTVLCNGRKYIWTENGKMRFA